MMLAERFATWLTGRPASTGADIVGWRFEVVEGHGLRAGIRDSQVGGPYEGPGVAVGVGGGLELRWSDGSFTRAGLDREALLAADAALDGWRLDALLVRQEPLPPLAGPADLPVVQVFDPAVAAMVAGGAESCLRMLVRLLSDSASAGIARTDAVMRASRNERTVATSEGFHAHWHETACTIELWGNESANASYGRRCLPGPCDLDRLVAQVADLTPSMGTGQELPSQARGVLFMPPVVEELLTRLVLPNLAGRAIRDGRSPFSRADLKVGRPILRSDLDLTVDTTVAFELATAPCSAEGIPAGRARLISGGRLASPLLDRATAAQFGLPPTPVPRGRPAVRLDSALPTMSYAEALEILGCGVVVRDLPGLHTQQARRSSYALVSPDAQAVEHGRAGGRCSVRLAGNVLLHLTEPSSHLVQIPGDPGIGLLVRTGVEILPG
jgi:predicted Zn-dependent protease